MGTQGRRNAGKGAGKRGARVVRPEPGQVLHDENGYRIGDDGYPMTSSRRRLHRLLDTALIFGYLSIAAAVVLVVLALFQGQSYTPDDFIAYGGNEFAGHSTAALMRAEALAAFIVGLCSTIVSRRGFAWMYDGADGGAVRILAAVLAAASVAWCACLFAGTRLVDPVSCICLALMLALRLAMRSVDIERRTLRPSVPAQRKEHS